MILLEFLKEHKVRSAVHRIVAGEIGEERRGELTRWLLK